MFNMVASGSAETAKGENKFFEFATPNLKSADYPHLESTTIGKGAAAKTVPVVKISPASILVREFPSIVDAKAWAIESGASADRFEEIVLDLLNTSFRNETVKIVRSRVTEAKLIPADVREFAEGAADEVNIFAETERAGGRESLKAKQEKAAVLASQLQADPAKLALELMALFGVKA
jgi:hypothetical protein